MFVKGWPVLRSVEDLLEGVFGEVAARDHPLVSLKVVGVSRVAERLVSGRAAGAEISFGAWVGARGRVAAVAASQIV
jgi:hypothetical protein